MSTGSINFVEIEINLVNTKLIDVYAQPQASANVAYGSSQPINNLPYGLTPGQPQPSEAFGKNIFNPILLL